jgi:hypothetical protein
MGVVGYDARVGPSDWCAASAPTGCVGGGGELGPPAYDRGGRAQWDEASSLPYDDT